MKFKPRELIGYTGESCPKCGRVRVEEYTCIDTTLDYLNVAINYKKKMLS